MAIIIHPCLDRAFLECDNRGRQTIGKTWRRTILLAVLLLAYTPETGLGQDRGRVFNLTTGDMEPLPDAAASESARVEQPPPHVQRRDPIDYELTLGDWQLGHGEYYGSVNENGQPQGSGKLIFTTPQRQDEHIYGDWSNGHLAEIGTIEYTFANDWVWLRTGTGAFSQASTGRWTHHDSIELTFLEAEQQVRALTQDAPVTPSEPVAAYFRLTVNAEPNDGRATLYIDGDQQAEIPTGGNAIIDVPAGTQPRAVQAWIRIDTLQSSPRSIILYAGGTTNISLVADRRIGATLTVTAISEFSGTPIPDGQVWDGARLLGKFGVPLDVPPGTYALKARAANHHSEKFPVTVKGDDDVMVPISLTALPIPVRLRLTQPLGNNRPTVQVVALTDGRQVAERDMDADGRLNLSLEEGEYEFIFRHAKLQEHRSDPLRVYHGMPEPEPVTLLYKEFTLKLTVQADDNLLVNIEGDRGVSGTLVSGEPRRIPIPGKPGQLALIASAKGFDNHAFALDVTAGGQANIKIELTKKTATPAGPRETDTLGMALNEARDRLLDIRWGARRFMAHAQEPYAALADAIQVAGGGEDLHPVDRERVTALYLELARRAMEVYGSGDMEHTKPKIDFRFIAIARGALLAAARINGLNRITVEQYDSQAGKRDRFDRAILCLTVPQPIVSGRLTPFQPHAVNLRDSRVTIDSPWASRLSRGMQLTVGQLEAVSADGTVIKQPYHLEFALIPDGRIDLLDSNAPHPRPWVSASPFFMTRQPISFGALELYSRDIDKLIEKNPSLTANFANVSFHRPRGAEPTHTAWNVTPDLAFSFCNWLNVKAGIEPVYERRNEEWRPVRLQDGSSVTGFRLPSTAEWQFAARYGLDIAPVAGYPRWEQLQELIGQIIYNGPNANNAIAYALVNIDPLNERIRHPGDSSARPYPTGLWNVCGNVHEFCVGSIRHTSDQPLDLKLCGGSVTSGLSSEVMPWASTSEDQRHRGFRVVWPMKYIDLASPNRDTR